MYLFTSRPSFCAASIFSISDNVQIGQKQLRVNQWLVRRSRVSAEKMAVLSFAVDTLAATSANWMIGPSPARLRVLYND